MATTGRTPWRSLGDTTPETFKAEFARRGSPILAEAEAVYAAVAGHSLLYLAHCGKESEYANTGEGAKVADHNPLGNRNPDGTYRAFPSYAANAAWYVQHVTDPNGPYAATTTLAEYVHVYAPASDGNDEAAYVAFVCDCRDRFPTPGGSTMAGHVPMPAFINRFDIGNNHYIGQGRSDDAQRQGMILGTCYHTSEGTFSGNVNAFSDPTWGGLTDAQVGCSLDGQYNGVLMLFIDPASGVVPWANGGIGTDATPTAQANAYMNNYGWTDYAVNGRIRSIECADGGNAAIDRSNETRQKETLCLYLAYVHAEECGQSAATFNWDFQHRDFGGNHQQCPGTWLINHRAAMTQRVKDIINAYQNNTALATPLTITYPPNWSGGTIAQPGAVTPVAAYKVGDRVKVTSGPANFRSGPSTSNTVIEVIQNGGLLCVTGAPQSNGGYTWYPAANKADGKAGYLVDSVLSMDAASGCGTALKTTAPSVNVRSGPATTFPILGTIATTGTVVTWDGTSQVGGSYTWDRCSTPFGVGWIANSYLATP